MTDNLLFFDFISNSRYIKYPLKWALINKLKSLQGKDICLEPKWCDVGQDSCQGDLREKF